MCLQKYSVIAFHGWEDYNRRLENVSSYALMTQSEEDKIRSINKNHPSYSVKDPESLSNAVEQAQYPSLAW